VEPGQKVASGEILLHIEEGDFADNVDEAEAMLAQETNAIARDKHLLELITKESDALRRELQRLEQLGQESLASKSNYDGALQRLLQRQAEEARLRHSVETSRARIKTRRAALNREQRNLDRTKLVAPFAGTINSVIIEVGDFATAGQVAIELVQLDTLDLYLEVTGSIVNQLSLGQEVIVYVDDKPHKGPIIAIAADPDPETHTHALRIRLMTNGLYPGQLAMAELPGQLLSDALVVPVSSILREEGKSYVFKVEKNHVVRHPVILLQRLEQWQVIEGIEADKEIIARDVATLASGQEVVVNKKM
jgi:RND family efflux transporter MFP subunit